MTYDGLIETIQKAVIEYSRANDGLVTDIDFEWREVVGSSPFLSKVDVRIVHCKVYK